MTEEESEENLEIEISYTPMELITILQLLDYLDVSMLKEGVPLGAISMFRHKIFEAILREDVASVLEGEKEDRMEKFEELMGGDSEEFPDELGNAFQ